TDEEGENPKEITKDGKTYVLVGHKKDSSAETGKVIEGTTTVVYEYKEKEEPQPQPQPEPRPQVKEGNVIVEYRDEEGNELKTPRTDTPKSPVGTDYNTDEPGENPRIIEKNGIKYELVRVSGKETGKVVEGTTKVVYIYKKVTTSTPIPPVQTSNNEIKPMQNQKVVTSKGKLPNTGIETSSTLPGLTLIGLIGLAVRRKLKEDK
ncbi:MucBP domain-containing protein, partial [Gemella cuniculi]|uniref:MucBP domain-containing protein n=1 Tax=Gemella cuniculi TaxID=150240 RepID=UPI0004864610